MKGGKKNLTNVSIENCRTLRENDCIQTLPERDLTKSSLASSSLRHRA